jgi:hypothetical protein
VRTKLGLMAIASTAVIAAMVFTGAVPALANQTDQFHITNGNTSYYMLSVNVPNQPLKVTTGGGTAFSNVHGATWSYQGGSRPVYEWEQGTTNRCWSYNSANGALVQNTCSAGNKNELFWINTPGQIINEAATLSKGADYCVNVTHAVPGATINVIGCKSRSAPGGFDQYWTY